MKQFWAFRVDAVPLWPLASSWHWCYTLVSRPFISTVQWSLLFTCLGGIGGFFLSPCVGRMPSSSCISRATSGGTSWCLSPEEGGRKLALLRQFIRGVAFKTGLDSQIKGTWEWTGAWRAWRQGEERFRFVFEKYMKRTAEYLWIIPGKMSSSTDAVSGNNIYLQQASVQNYCIFCV